MGRLLQFRKELAILWRAFLAPETPWPYKALMLLLPAYLLSPIDFIPDVVPVLGWLDDLVVIPLLVSWLVSLLPHRAQARAGRGNGERVIEGEYRRL